jgi:8-oxo-dGTP diphosphatase
MIERRVNVRGIVAKDGKILAQQLTPGIDKISRDDWMCTPGGGLEAMESLEEGLAREMIEETGISPKIGRLLFIQQFVRGNGVEQLEFFYLIENYQDYQSIDLSKTSHGIEEVKWVGFVDPKSANVLPKFLQEIDITDFIQNNRPVRLIDNLYENK